ncbi:MAG: glycosyltransferase [Planctomycetia bacterium]|nr:glycosyltransferase [Planctomycetia bacterium]MBL6915781.1 glycosyltransferase [Planctomycetota bacterium]
MINESDGLGTDLLSIVIPVWDGAKFLGSAVEATLEYVDSLDEDAEVIVVSDGCTDNPQEVMAHLSHRDKRAKFIILDKHRGKGAAVRAGVLAAKGDFVAMLDVDLSARPEMISVLQKNMEPEVSIVCGSRSIPGADLPVPQKWHRRCAGYVFSSLVHFFSGIQVQDSQCGCKLFRSEHLKPIFVGLKTEGFAFDVEVLLKAEQSGLVVREVPITWSDSGESKVRFIRDGMKMLWTVLTLRRR